MIKIECGDCRCDLNTGDLIFCEDCHKKLESQVEELKEAYDRGYEDSRRYCALELENISKI